MTTSIECAIHPHGHHIAEKGGRFIGFLLPSGLDADKYLSCIAGFQIVDWGQEGDERNGGKHRVDLIESRSLNQKVIWQGESMNEQQLRAFGLKNLTSIRCE